MRAARTTGDIAILVTRLEQHTNAMPPAKRVEHARTAQRLREMSAPEIMITHEDLQADPRAFALAKLAGQIDEDTWDEVQAAVIEACKAEVLSFKDEETYLDIGWWGGLDDHRTEDRDPELQASSLRLVLFGSTQFLVDGAVVDDFGFGRAYRWHDREGMVDSKRALEALLAQGPPPMNTLVRSHACVAARVMYDMADRSVGEEPFEDQIPRMYSAYVPQVRRCLERTIKFYDKCVRRGWEVWIAGD